MLPEVGDWLRRRTSMTDHWRADELVAAKNGVLVSVVLPTRNEQATVGEIVTVVRRELMERTPLVDEVVVIDQSEDLTAMVAAAAGARVFAQDEVLTGLSPMMGKGDALWKSLAVTVGDVVVVVDADLLDFGAHFITGLLGPLLTDGTVGYVKGCYDRPYVLESVRLEGGGGRVTELVARPLINMHWPLLAGVIQPLGGEYAARRSLLERLPFVTGYGVELGLLVDALELAGLDALAQVDLGTRTHTHQPPADLAVMAGQIMLTAWSRLSRQGQIAPFRPPAAHLTQFHRARGGHRATVRDMGVAERPPMLTVADYRDGRGRLFGMRSHPMA
jgi:glucosyl-3-phosphoglycerate synthase